MPKVKTEVLEKLQKFLLSLPSEVAIKCSLCNETLTDICKRAEVETGAGTATVTRVLAEKINDNAPPQDRVTPESLRQKVLEKSGEKTRKSSNGTNKPEKDPLTWRCATCEKEYPIAVKRCFACEPKEQTGHIQNAKPMTEAAILSHSNKVLNDLWDFITAHSQDGPSVVFDLKSKMITNLLFRLKRDVEEMGGSKVDVRNLFKQHFPKE